MSQRMNEECPAGQWCFIDIDCPVTTILEPDIDSSNSDNENGGGGGRKKKPKPQQLSSSTTSSGGGGSGGTKINGGDKHIIGYYGKLFSN